MKTTIRLLALTLIVLSGIMIHNVMVIDEMSKEISSLDKTVGIMTELIITKLSE